MRDGDYLYLLAPPEKAQALDRFFVDMPPPAAPDPRLLGDFFVSGDVTLGALGEIYGLSIAPDAAEVSLADHIAEEVKRRPRQGDVVPLGPIALLAHRVTDGRVTSVGLRLAGGARPAERPATLPARVKKLVRDWLEALDADWAHRRGVLHPHAGRGCAAHSATMRDQRGEPVGKRCRSRLQNQRRLNLVQRAALHCGNAIESRPPQLSPDGISCRTTNQ